MATPCLTSTRASNASNELLSRGRYRRPSYLVHAIIYIQKANLNCFRMIQPGEYLEQRAEVRDTFRAWTHRDRRGITSVIGYRRLEREGLRSELTLTWKNWAAPFAGQADNIVSLVYMTYFDGEIKFVLSTSTMLGPESGGLM